MCLFTRYTARLALWLGVTLCPLWAHSGSLGINPIRVDLSAARPTAAITLSNTGGTSMVVQLQVSKWSAAGEEDRYDPSPDILVTPPIFTIAPGVSQIIRVGLSSASGTDRELAYRLFVEEVPSPPKPGYQGLQVALRLGIPVFVEAAQATQSKLQWSAVRTGADAISIQVGNVGGAHARILNINLSAPGESRILASQVAASYLLPGQTKRWNMRLSRPWQGRQVYLSATTDQGVTHAELELQSP
ncbi:MAG: molecular chaperone [Rhodocyclales bacterium]|nr:molecular chaperone [Rhodocyclales bacterium]